MLTRSPGVSTAVDFCIGASVFKRNPSWRRRIFFEIRLEKGKWDLKFVAPK
jgi:hypothetical protein